MFYIIGLDPGNNLGISIFLIDSQSFTIENIIAYSVSFEEYRDTDRLLRMEDCIKNLCLTYRPLAIAREEVFVNKKFPKSSLLLSNFVAVIDISIMEINNNIKLFRFAPKEIKSVVSTGDANKIDMLNAISSIEEINSKLNINLLTEHAIDATAIAYTMLKILREYKLILLSI